MSGSVKTEVRTYRNYVNGQWIASASGETFQVYDPSTEEVIARVAAANSADVDVAVKAARAVLFKRLRGKEGHVRISMGEIEKERPALMLADEPESFLRIAGR